MLDGQIKRGDGQFIDAAIWYSDLRGSTEMADQLSAQDYIEILNSYFDTTGGAVLDHDGEILNFIGDGLLAIFQRKEGEENLELAAKRAELAALDASVRLSKLNRQRKRKKLPQLRYGLALHVGTLVYGNVGVPERLTFSAFGAAVNEVVRMEALTKKLGEPLLVSDAFANCMGSGYRSLGAYELRGVGEAVGVLAPEQKPARAA